MHVSFFKCDMNFSFNPFFASCRVSFLKFSKNILLKFSKNIIVISSWCGNKWRFKISDRKFHRGHDQSERARPRQLQRLTSCVRFTPHGQTHVAYEFACVHTWRGEGGSGMAGKGGKRGKGGINVFTQGQRVHGLSRVHKAHDREKRDRQGWKGKEGGGRGRESERQGIGRRPRSAIRYIALRGVYRFSGSYQLSLLGDISMISARKRSTEAEREGGSFSSVF